MTYITPEREGTYTPRDPATLCAMPTATLRTCKRRATVFYVRTGLPSFPEGLVKAQYCAQHDRASGRFAILRPRPWEFDHKHTA